jgi:hypothetical protein
MKKKLKLITKSELSKLGNVSKPLISKYCIKKWAAAVHKSGEVDLNHPLVQNWLAEREKKKNLKPQPKKKRKLKKNKSHNENFISKSELSKIAGGFSDSAISRYCKPDGRWAIAVHKSGKVDLNHPLIQEWLSDRKKQKDLNKDLIDDLEEINVKKYENFTIKEICERYSSIEKFQDFIKTRKLLIETEYKKIQIEANRGELINKDLVAKACFSLIDLAFKKLLDMPSGIINRISAILELGDEDCHEQSEKVLTVEVSKILKACKKEITDILEHENN